LVKAQFAPVHLAASVYRRTVTALTFARQEIADDFLRVTNTNLDVVKRVQTGILIERFAEIADDLKK